MFRKIHHIAKMNRPFSDMIPPVELQKISGLVAVLILHSRYSENLIIATVDNKMRRRIVKNVVENNSKLPVLIDESITLSLKLVLIVNLKAFIGITSLIFLDL